MRPRLVVVLLLPALAGCLASDDGIPGSDVLTAPAHSVLPDGSPAPASIPWNDCIVHGAGFPARVEDLRPHLADGLEPVAYPGIPDVPGEPTGTLAVWAVSSHICEESTDLWVTIPVTPSQSLADHASFWSVPVRILTDNATTAQVMNAWGVAAIEYAGLAFVMDQAGTARVQQTSAEPPDGSLELATAATGFQQVGPRTSRVLAVEDGAIAGIIDFSWGDHMASAPGQGSFRAGAAPFAGASSEADGFGFQGWGADYTISQVDPPTFVGEE